MMQIMLCPDGQSPELSIPCPVPHVAPGGGLTDLPDTGFDIWVYVVVASLMILIGVGIWLYEKHLERLEADE